jgi:hypothetical protein
MFYSTTHFLFLPSFLGHVCMTLFPLDSAVIFILKDVTFHPTLRALWLSDPLPTAQSAKRRGNEVSVFHPLQFMSL